MPTPDPKPEADAADAVGSYKRILSEVLDQRPSGTRQRLAAALGKNRSFVSQISNPAYATPIPASHVDTLFDVCHFSGDERKRFLAAYALAHPRRPVAVHEHHRTRAHTVYLPDFGSEAKNERVRLLISEFAASLARIILTEK